tara:strand:- start:44 stop:1696 length:1653 start_codon:yes stop_codon:yes gene_type:complete
MAISLSIKQLAVMALSLVLIVLGILFIAQVSEITSITDEIPRPFSSDELTVEVTPGSSQKGTHFLIKADTLVPKEYQSLELQIQSDSFNSPVTLYDDGEHFDDKPKDGIYAGFFDSSDAPLGDYEISKQSSALAEFTIYESSCETISGIAKDDKINFVILPSGYESYNDFKADAKSLLTSPDSLLTIDPFKSNKDQFSFSLVDSSVDLECTTSCSNVENVVCCNNEKVIQEASQCHFDSVFVLINSADLCGSASTYAKVCAQHRVSNLALVHELGHSFAGLADEYVYNNYDIGTVDAPNCAPTDCAKWNPITDECIPGCTYDDLYRSSQDSIMRSYTPVFNEVSKTHIELLISNHIKKTQSSDLPAPRKSYLANLEYDNGRVEITHITLKPIKPGVVLKESEYTAELLDTAGDSLFKTPLALPTLILPLPDSDATPIKQDEFTYPILLPYSQDAEVLLLSKSDTLVQAIPLEVFQDKCGNNLCDNSENHLSCPIDCKLETDNFCEVTSCDPNCPSQKHCQNNKTFMLTFAILLILGSLIAIVVVFLKSRR